MMPRHPFLRSFWLVLLAVSLLHAAVAALYLARPDMFYYRAWEYLIAWSNLTTTEDSRWEGTEYSDLGHQYLFYYQESRDTIATTDADGFRSVPGDMGPPRIFTQGRSNVFGSGVSDQQTFAWQLAELGGVATFNGAHGELLATLSRPDLAQVELVIDIYHERHLAKLPLARRIYSLQGDALEPYEPMARHDLPPHKAMQRRILRPGWWLPDIIARQWRRLLKDFKEYRVHGHRPYLTLANTTDGSPLESVIALMEERRRVVEGLGYHYLAMIIPARQTVYEPAAAKREALERGTRIAEQLEARGYPLVNLFPSFRSERGPDFYFRYDTHWNPLGQQHAAAMVVADIRRRWPDLLPADSANPEAP